MLRVVTLNTWKCDGDYAARLAAMQRGLAALAPDVICLQECFAAQGSPGAEATADTARTLSQALGMHCVQVAAREKTRCFLGAPVASTSGLAILARVPTESPETLTLPSDPADGERIAQAVTLAWGAGRLAVVNLHLTHLRNDALRAAQLSAVLARWSPDTRPLIIAGDFNGAFEDDAFAALRAHPGLDVGPTPPTAWPGTRIARPGRPAIDHVFLLRSGSEHEPRIVERANALEDIDPGGVHASDHAAVVVDLDLP